MQKNARIAVIVLALCGYSLISKANTHDQDTAIKTIAIIPFSVSIDTGRLLNGVSVENILRSEQISSYRFQRSLYIWFLKKQRKYNVTFQDIIITRDILNKNGLEDSVVLMGKQELCSLLGVDAIIYSKIFMKKPRSQEGSNFVNGITGLPISASNKINFELTVYDASGILIWKQVYEARGDISSESIIDNAMRGMARKFPFKK